MLDPALARAAMQAGAEWHDRCRVEELVVDDGRFVGMITEAVSPREFMAPENIAAILAHGA